MRAVALACALVPAVLAAQTPPPPVPSPSPSTPGAARPTPPQQRTVEFDLLAPAAQTGVLTAPRGEIFIFVVKNRIPYGSYRVTYDWTIAPGSPIAASPAERHRVVDLRKPVEGNFRRLPVAGCDDLYARLQDVLDVKEERELPDKLSAFRARSGEPGCSLGKHLESNLGDFIRSETYPIHRLYEGDELSYTVERLDDGGTVLKSWRVTVRSQPVGLGWAYPSEEAWIVGETSRDVVEMLSFARDRALPPAEALAFGVTADRSAASPRYTVAFSAGRAGRIEQRLDFGTCIWSPASYEPLAATLLRALRLQPAKPSAEGPVTEALVNPRAGVLAAESRRISLRLEKEMLDPAAHEQAALVLGALALREAAGGFSDVRPALSRMAAHLAIARALRHPAPVPTTGYAEALLMTLMNRQRDALDRLDALERGPVAPAWQPFLRALRIRNTRDWRILKEPGRATLLERLEQYRALQQSVGPSEALAFLETFAPEPISDWGRVSLQGDVSIEQGRALGPSVAALEMGEMAEVWTALHGGPLAPEGLADALNAPVARAISAPAGVAPAPQVIGWGLWARFFQRNLCFEAEATSKFLGEGLGVADAMKQVRAGFDTTLSALELWPAVTLGWQAASQGAGQRVPGAGESDRKEACARAAALAEKTPEVLTPHAWAIFDPVCHEARQTQALPRMSRWLVGMAPAGTALVDIERIMGWAALRQDPHPVYVAMHEIAPFHPVVLEALDPGRTAEPEEVAALYGALADYDARVITRVASATRGDVAQVRAAYERAAAIEPEKYIALGDYLQDVGLADDAAAAYEKAIETVRDRVLLSLNLRWLVGYYCDHGRLDRAEEVARVAAETYSAGGFRAMAHFQERTGHYTAAEDWYRRMVERYGDEVRGPLDGFYIRYVQRVGDGRFAREGAAARARIFPAGLERVSMADFVSPPKPGEGALVTRASRREEGFGLRDGDLVVAFNGYRVRDQRQYDTVLTFDDRPEATAIVFRQGGYVEVKGRLERIAYGRVSGPA